MQEIKGWCYMTKKKFYFKKLDELIIKVKKEAQDIRNENIKSNFYL